MTNITRWTPFRQLARLDSLSDVEDAVRGLGLRMLSRDVDSPLEMRMDITEKEGSYQTVVDLPGIDKDKIEVSIDRNQVSIKAEVDRQTRKLEGKEIHSERYCGSSFRSFTLPQEIDEAKAQAKYENGVLTLTLPKKSNGRNHRIAVS
jgi:HSP20 family protein